MSHGRHLLRAWLRRSQMKQKELAPRIGVSNPYLCQILLGNRRPGLETLVAIETITGVPVKSWVDIRRGKSDAHAETLAESANVYGQ